MPLYRVEISHTLEPEDEPEELGHVVCLPTSLEAERLLHKWLKRTMEESGDFWRRHVGDAVDDPIFNYKINRSGVEAWLSVGIHGICLRLYEVESNISTWEDLVSGI